MVQDVSQDGRYLPTLGDTRGEMIMPVSGSNGSIVGTIDVESAVVNAFSDRDQALLEEFARADRHDVSEKRMFGGIAFMVRGHMSVGVVKDDLMVRVGPEAHEGEVLIDLPRRASHEGQGQDHR
jgi:hypothetical protein